MYRKLKLFVMLSICLLIAPMLSLANTLPTDSLVTITLTQLQLTNIIFAEHQYYKNLVYCDSLEIDTYKCILDLYERNTDKLDSLLRQCEFDSVLYQLLLEKRLKKLKRSRIFNLILTSTILGILIGIVTK